MKILGINCNLLHDSGAALVVDGKLAAAVNEERFTRVKQQRGVPLRSVEAVLETLDIKPSELDCIHIVGYPPVKKIAAFIKTFFRLLALLKFDLIRISFSKDKFQSVVSRRMASSQGSINMAEKALKDEWGMAKLVRSLKKLGFKGKIRYIPHKLCHIYAAYSASGFAGKCLILNIEGSSFEHTVNAYIGEKGIITEVVSTPDPHSAGHFYAAFTELLGFKPGFDEGKVTGLSAWGRIKKQPDGFKKLHEIVQQMLGTKSMKLKLSDKVFLFPYYFSQQKKLPIQLKGFQKEDIAWAAQKRLEEVVTDLASRLLKKTDCKKIVLTGGVCANVRMNQTIAELPEVKKLFVYPGMGDFGNAHGAAAAPVKGTEIKVSRLKNLYLGPQFGDVAIEEALKKNGLKYEKPKVLKLRVAKLLKDKKIIAVFRGRMEYGPRALGNRSILASAADKKTAEKLNRLLKRDEFMPFAPVVLFEQRFRCFKDIKKAQSSAEFMTITFNCTPFMAKKCPAVVHIDGTARPQLLKNEATPFVYGVLLVLVGYSVMFGGSTSKH